MPTTSMPNGPSKPYRNATSDNAADFLDKVTAEMPWPVKAIQIAGGSEFMAEFELACAAKPIPLYLLPPRSPKLNGAVERCNGAWRYEFYAVVDLPHDIDKIAEHVDAFQQPAGAECSASSATDRPDLRAATILRARAGSDSGEDMPHIATI